MTGLLKKTFKTIYTNKPITREFVVNNIQLMDLINFYKWELNKHFEIVKGYIFEDGYNPKIKEIINNLFELRKQYKALKNPVQVIVKLVMNSVYGKTIEKATQTKIECHIHR